MPASSLTMALKAQTGGEAMSLILDSGSTDVISFRTPAAMARTYPVSTTFGMVGGARSTVPTCWTADMYFDRVRVGMLPAAIVQGKGLCRSNTARARHRAVNS